MHEEGYCVSELVGCSGFSVYTKSHANESFRVMKDKIHGLDALTTYFSRDTACWLLALLPKHVCSSQL